MFSLQWDGSFFFLTAAHYNMVSYPMIYVAILIPWSMKVASKFTIKIALDEYRSA